ncbi:low molecular weight phosphatase family protein [Celerinatantimonas sp. YJH-8]|uniref:arsenate-mycothiol transferase ArsC n=1 Tax=Celerinatantimonas sp. YJH-8 TaxID=3228714 RepID=UPI0038CB9497
MKQVLFLCTGNYYRSRLAEEYFNYWAARLNLPYRASSRALLQDLSHTGNKGTIAAHVRNILDHLAITGRAIERAPKSVTYEELEQSDYIFAMDQREHQPLVDAYYPEFKMKFRYFSIGDDDIEPVAIATERLMNQLDLWIARLCEEHPESKHAS